MIYVSPLSRIEDTVRRVGAERLISLLSVGTEMVRPVAIQAENHLLMNMHDIAAPQDGMTLPGEAHVRQLLDFARAWDRSRPLAINCWAGVSRSTASAYIIAAAFDPSRDETELALLLRKLSPTATPNPRLIAVADQILGRNGRMVAAIAAIGRGADCFEGVPFGLEV
ncbi:tyrosine phosphatase family protein [Aminobacter anthyllidis]|uniref:tyrosine phosphatase family protein n=1 Tax=Aminobacter anthyllidis TaxID=1035067 RepID=UPI0024570B4B|nr:tyrosine phosphatase family protein [Aminobacter anthyllidis]MDH4988911.1 tyrosine phosphatase family protein [Aminobacter anthyllidis]